MKFSYFLSLPENWNDVMVRSKCCSYGQTTRHELVSDDKSDLNNKNYRSSFIVLTYPHLPLVWKFIFELDFRVAFRIFSGISTDGRSISSLVIERNKYINLYTCPCTESSRMFLATLPKSLWTCSFVLGLRSSASPQICFITWWNISAVNESFSMPCL